MPYPTEYSVLGDSVRWSTVTVAPEQPMQADQLCNTSLKMVKMDNNVKSPAKRPYLSNDGGPGGEMTILNQGTEDEIEVWGYHNSNIKYTITILGIMCTLGLLALPLYWIEWLWLYCTASTTKLSNATSVLILHRFQQRHVTRFVKKVRTRRGNNMLLPVRGQANFKAVNEYRFFTVKKHKYVWDAELGSFFRSQGTDVNVSLQSLHAGRDGLAQEDSQKRAAFYGKNEIQVPVYSIPVLLVKEILSPFYVFQLFSVCFWYADAYYLYASAILAISGVSLSVATYNTRKNQHKLRNTVEGSDTVTVIRPGGITEQIMSCELVPGDILEVSGGGSGMFCDAVLLEGQAIMNESMLTGESVPITKTAAPREDGVLYDPAVHEKHTLKCGTRVIQTRRNQSARVTAIVTRTGYLTSKGDLVRSILYPYPVDFKFEADSYKFIMVMATIATAGMIYTLAKMVNDEEPWNEIILEVFDLITIVVPPALPAAMTIGVVIAQKRLERQGIFCISPRTINVSGSTDCVCFDKTGTITEDGMDMWGVVPTELGLSSATLDDPLPKVAEFASPQRKVHRLPAQSNMMVGMAICHELNKIDGCVMGDPLDEKMFESTGWSLEQEEDKTAQVDPLVISYVRSPVDTMSGSVLQAAPQRLLPFSSANQCMSVVCRLFEEQTDGFTEPVCCVYCKGSPEKIGRLCRPESLPNDFYAMLAAYAGHGYRLLALATKKIPVNLAKTARINRMARSEIESGLDFLGLIVLENRLKPASAGVLRELHDAKIRSVMVTGDNILTAVCVAQDCGMVPANEPIVRVQVSTMTDCSSYAIELSLLQASGKGAEAGSTIINMETASALDYHYATDGPSFEIIARDYKEEVLPLLLTRGVVFARMKPDMKQHLVGLLQGLGFYVAMCGDGANDCGALKAAHVGISLSEAEASVASPFTSRQADIACVPRLIKEGRAALVTSFSIFKYMAAYSITQFVSVMILYEVYSNLSDTQYLYIDLFVITSLASVLGVNKTHSGQLTSRPPLNSLIAALPLFSLLSQLAIVIVFQFCSLYLTRLQPWFVPFDYENSCYNGTDAQDNFEELGLLELGKCDKEENPVASYENYALFSVSQFQYIILAAVFAKGAPFRESSFKNFPLVATVSLLTAFSLYLAINPHGPILYYPVIGFELFLPPPDYLTFRFLLLAMVAGNTFIAFLCEICLADGLVQRLFRRGQKPAEKVADQLLRAGNGGWPLGGTTLVDSNIKTVSSSASLPPLRASDDVLIVEKNVDTPSRAFDDLFAHAQQLPLKSSGKGSPSLSIPLLGRPPSTPSTSTSSPKVVNQPPDGERIDSWSSMATHGESHVDATLPNKADLPAVIIAPTTKPSAPPPSGEDPCPWLPSSLEAAVSQEAAVDFPTYPTKNIAVTEPEITKEISKI